MYSSQFTVKLSLLLQSILNLIGASQFFRGIRRFYCSQEECLNRMIFRNENVETHVFGSRSEGTTTAGLDSDRDVLECFSEIELIESLDQANNEHFTLYGFIFKDENTHPGYVKLQVCAHDMPLTVEHIDSLKPLDLYNYLACEDNKLLLKNGYGRQKMTCDEINGPARTDITETSKYKTTRDRVFALKSVTWPNQASAWFKKNTRRFWPRQKVQMIIKTFGCFITPVGHVDSEFRSVEWRLSLSMAERALIWALNETQFKCVVVLKIVTKQLIKRKFPDSITSYHCKNVVFSVIETTPRKLWQARHLVVCVHMCLLRLLHFVKRGYIPQYFIPENNLLKHKLSKVNRSEVAYLIQNMIENADYKFFLAIECDGIGDIIFNVFSEIRIPLMKTYQKRNKCLLCLLIHQLMDQFVYWRHKTLTTVVSKISLNKNILSLPNAIYIHFDMLAKLQKSVIEYKTLCSFNAAILMDIMSSHLCSSIGHHLLTFGSLVNERKRLLQTAAFLMGFRYIREGYKDDSISNKLKYAHVLFRCGLFQRALNVLEQIEDSLTVQHASVITICCCRGMTKQSTKADVEIMLTHSLERLLGNVTAHCVYYLRTELEMAPSVLVYEMFRSFGHEIEVTDMHRKWMQHAAVDPVIMLFYLKYVCYVEIGDIQNQEAALSEICNTINEDPNLGHTETALNILGYCFMERGMYGEAFQCFRKSLFYDLAHDTDKFPIRESKHQVKRLQEHNAAKIHLCVLVARVFQSYTSRMIS